MVLPRGAGPGGLDSIHTREGKGPGSAPEEGSHESVARSTGVGARKGQVTRAESQQEKGGYMWLRGVLGRGGREGACRCGHPRAGVPGRPGVCAPQSLGWRGEPGSVSGRCWVWAASSLGCEAWVGPQRLTSPAGGPGAAKAVGWLLVREQEPADARGMPPAPLPPVMQFFIVGGLAVPQPLPADRELGIRGLAPAERGGRDRASSLSTRCRPRSQLEFLVSTTPLPPGQERQTPPSPAGSEPQGALEGAGGREGVSSLCLRSGFLVPRRAPPRPVSVSCLSGGHVTS